MSLVSHTIAYTTEHNTSINTNARRERSMNGLPEFINDRGARRVVGEQLFECRPLAGGTVPR
jgi:hypothetical protein